MKDTFEARWEAHKKEYAVWKQALIAAHESGDLKERDRLLCNKPRAVRR